MDSKWDCWKAREVTMHHQTFENNPRIVEKLIVLAEYVIQQYLQCVLVFLGYKCSHLFSEHGPYLASLQVEVTSNICAMNFRCGEEDTIDEAENFVVRVQLESVVGHGAQNESSK